MICIRCRDMHAGDDLAMADAGISLTLGDCPKGGARHEWRRGHFVMDIPFVGSVGDYRVRPATLEEARAHVREPLLISCLTTPVVSRLLSRMLDVPLVYHKRPFFMMDVGDRALAPLVINPRAAAVDDISKLVQGRDYELVIVERIA